MSEAAAARLRKISEQQKTQEEANRMFVRTFLCVPRDTQTMQAVLNRIDRSMGNWREADKVLLCLARGWRPTEPHHVFFFGELAREERDMSDAEFRTHLRKFWPKEEVIPEAETVPRCANKYCKKGPNRERGFVTSGKFCSALCKTVSRKPQKSEPRAE